MYDSCVLGYTYNAGVHCVDCAELKFNSDSHLYLRELLELPKDSEGNVLVPIFEWHAEQFEGEDDCNCDAPCDCEDCGIEIFG